MKPGGARALGVLAVITAAVTLWAWQHGKSTGDDPGDNQGSGPRPGNAPLDDEPLATAARLPDLTVTSPTVPPGSRESVDHVAGSDTPQGSTRTSLPRKRPFLLDVVLLGCQQCSDGELELSLDSPPSGREVPHLIVVPMPHATHRASVDVRDVLADLDAGVDRSLLLSASIEGRVIAQRTVRVPGPPSPEREEAEEVPRREVVLVADTSALISGTVIGFDGQPVADAQVAILSYGENDVVPSPVALGRSADDGTFLLVCAPAGRPYLACFDHLHAPLSRELQISFGEENNLGPVPLSLGETIEGRVSPAPGRDASGVSLGLYSKTVGTPIHFERETLDWLEGRLVRTTRSTQTDMSGSFRFTGLRRGYYALWINGPRGGACGMPGQDSVQVMAPVRGLVLADETAQVIIRVFRDSIDHPLARATVALSNGIRDYACSTDSEGRIVFLCPENRTYPATVTHEGMFTASIEVKSPARGEDALYDVVLQPMGESSLAVSVQDPHGVAVTEVEFVLTADVGGRSGLEHFRERQIAYDGVYRLEPVPSGQFFLEVHPVSRKRESPSYLCDALDSVTLAADERSHHSVVLQQGGRMELRIHNERGELLPAECSIRDPSGDSLHVVFEYVDELTGEWFTSTSVPHKRASRRPGKAQLRSALLPGTYEVTAELSGFQGARREVTIEPHKTVLVDIELREEAGR